MKTTKMNLVSIDACPFLHTEITNQSEEDPDNYTADYECNHPNMLYKDCVWRDDFVGCPLKRYPVLISIWKKKNGKSNFRNR